MTTLQDKLDALLACENEEYIDPFEAFCQQLVTDYDAVGDRFIATSSSTVTVGAGSKTFTLSTTGKSFAVGAYVMAFKTTDPTVYMIGQVTAFVDPTLTISVSSTNYGGGGSVSAWTIGLSAAPINGDARYVQSAGGDASAALVTPTGGTTAITLAARNVEYDARAWGVKADGTTDDLAAIYAGLDGVNALGGGYLVLPGGPVYISDTLTIGDGSNSQQSTKHHRVIIKGQGCGTGSEVSSVQGAGVTRIVYNGTTSSTKAVVQFAGPLHDIGLSNIVLDANSKAGIGLLNCHVTQSRFDRVVVKGFTAAAYKLTTRTGFPSGVAYGNADNLFIQCYSFGAASSSADGIVLTSGVSTATTLAGNPDSARNIFVGGTIFYGGGTGSTGCRLDGADNNRFDEVVFLPSGGNTGGYSVYFSQWPASTVFPHENLFTNCTGTQQIGGTSGTGGNTFWPLPTSDGVTQPLADANLTSLTHSGAAANIRALLKDGSASAPAMSFALEPVSGFYRKGTNVITAAISSTDVFDIRANEIRGPAATSGAGVTGYAGSTHIYSMTRSGNDARIAGFGSVILAAGATTGPTSGTNVLQAASTGVVSHNGGANTVINAASLLCNRPYTLATLPAAAANTNSQAIATDGTKGRYVESNGTNWLYMDGSLARSG